MAKQFDAFEDHHIAFIEKQHMFFVGSAAPEGRVNVSPKGMDSLRILGPNRLLWLNLTGSGNETAGHLLQANRMTVMWCSFTTQPMIMRAYGTARTVHVDDAGFAELAAHFPGFIGTRQIFDMSVEMVQTSCGFGVPFFDHVGERDTLQIWAEKRGPEGVRAYWEKNRETLDGAPTGIPVPE
ncbi:pyridoxamine 5'-phosphate oxidase family protein [Actibacterium sp. XHP0104]|uniref:pyridoxamine 5'-phosphate oxidase family protein n=1 Tax=Actibacterium sp. XHP0104 TaxID=2984335 RepID=UPI0021E81F3E|nr:pyridoxamine 5'-phosphate oxidase family protein [Actibacterium sp. XHP0104]MCV2881374.1 pyridoxamine 5'-phosphate oxidase family protein [Actibacterium sp. XHP0104]